MDQKLLLLSFSVDMESNLNKTFSLLKSRRMIKSGDLVIAVSEMLQSIQVMNIPWKAYLLEIFLHCLILQGGVTMSLSLSISL